MNTPNTIPITFINGYSRRKLCTALLPALPHPGDHLQLDTLPYQVTGCDWQLTPDGHVHIEVIVLPAINAEGERPFTYPEEKQLAQMWAAAAAETAVPGSESG